MDPIEEVAYRNRPPLLEDVSIQGPLRIPIKDAMQTLEEREAIEADFRWYRWSKFAAPWLIWCFLLSVTVFCLTAWQQVGGYKEFRAYTVGAHDGRPFVQQGVPRFLVKKSVTQDKDEAGQSKALRNVRIAVVTCGAFSLFMVFATLLVKPRPRIRTSLNWLWCLFLFATFVLGVVSFSMGIDQHKGAQQCPWNRENTWESCRIRKGFATIVIVLDACVWIGALTSTILLAYFNITGDWKLFRTGFRERERDAETEIVRRDEDVDKSLRKVRPVRMTVLTLALIFTSAAVIVLTIFIILLHLDYERAWPMEEFHVKKNFRGRSWIERGGWPARNTRLRYSLSIIGICSIVLNMIPFTHRVIAYLFAALYFLVSVLCFTVFGFDLHELAEAHQLACPIEMRCRNSPYIATVVIEFTLGISLLFYILYEYLAKGFTTSRWSGRNYCPHEIYKHDTKLDSMRPVRCEITGQVMTAKEYVYRYRFIAGTNPYYDQIAPELLPPAPMGPPLAAPVQVPMIAHDPYYGMPAATPYTAVPPY